MKEKGVEHIKIEDYPAIKNYLDTFYSELEKRTDKGNTIYNLRNCAYMDDFFKPKIIYPGIMRIAKNNKQNFPRFDLDIKDNFFFGNDCYFIVGNHLEYLNLFLNSTLLGYLFRYYIYSFDETGFKIFTEYFQNIPIPLPNSDSLRKIQLFLKGEINLSEINNWMYEMIGLTKIEIEEIENSIDDIFK